MDNEDPAWTEYRTRFANVYDDSNYTSPLQAAVMKASHSATERLFKEQDYFENVLEVGAGTGEHIAFIRHRFDKYVLSDVDPATLDVARAKLGNRFGEKISFSPQTGERLNYADNSFDRVIAVHVLEHIYRPHLVIKEWARVVRDGGVLSILIPTDPGIAWRLGRHLGPRKYAIAKGIAYDYVMAREHVNSCTNLVALLRHYFPDRVESWWPLRIPIVDLNLFFVFHTTIKKSSDQ